MPGFALKTLPLVPLVAILAACPSQVEEEPPPAPSPTPDPTPSGPGPLVRGLEIAAVTLNQGAEGRPVRGGAVLAESGLPVVAGRAALLRAYVAPNNDWDDRVVTATLELTGLPEDSGDDDDSAEVDLATYVDQKEISGFSDSAILESTFNFELPADAVQPGVEYSITLREIEHGLDVVGVEEGARMPAKGTAPLHALDWGGVLRVELIPVQYMADGSGRTPTVDDERVAVYRSWFERLYPVREVQVTVGDVYVSDMEVLADGTGFGDHLELMSDIREERDIPWDRYVYGLLAPAGEDERATWCASGCTLGLSYRTRNPNADQLRVSVGTSFEADRSSRTMLHELGHAHDRGHADCGSASNTDPDYPYANGGIGTWGWDLQERVLVDPGDTADLMSYCSPWWFSDYTFEALWDRIHMLEGIGDRQGREAKSVHRMVTVRPDGRLDLKGARAMPSPSGEFRRVEVTRRDGRVERVDGVYRPFNHIEGGTLLIPDEDEDIVSVR